MAFRNQSLFELTQYLLITISIVFLIACSDQSSDYKPLPDMLKIGAVPDDDVQVLRKRHTPLLNYLSRELGVDYQLIIPESYEDLLKQFSNGNIDLAYFGGFTFIKAHQKYGAIPIAMRDIDTRFTSYFIANKKYNDKELIDYKNRIFSFGSRLSTSGHLMPRYFLNKKVGKPENFFSEVLFSGSHKKTVDNIINGLADVGAVNANILDAMFEDGRLKPSDIKIVSETAPYPDYVWAVPAHTKPSDRIKLRNAFLSLLPTNAINIATLDAAGAGGFIPASTSEFEPLLDIAIGYGLLKASDD